MMRIKALHRWELEPRAAASLQERLAERLISDAPIDLRQVRVVAGVDVSVRGGKTCACVALLRFPDLEPLETVCARRPTPYPYIPGLLAFREGPAVLDALAKLTLAPDVYIFDGMGQMHPRRMGIAAHIGLWLDAPTIGCGKSHYIGDYALPGAEKGEHEAVVYRGERLGVVLRTRPQVKPVYVSVGHLADLPSAIELVLACAPKFRLPEPIRLAHRAAAVECG